MTCESVSFSEKLLREEAVEFQSACADRHQSGDVALYNNGRLRQMITCRETHTHDGKRHRCKSMEANLASCVRNMIECLGDDPDREALLRTPTRYAKAMLALTDGYSEDPTDLVNGAVFSEDSQLVMVKDIDFTSLCEHHMLPFIGKIHIGYFPSGQVLGLSKLARIAEVYSRRLQVQERLTKDIALFVEETLKPRGVGVIVEATHTCMTSRGVKKPGALTITKWMSGVLEEDVAAKNDFYSLLNH